MDYVDLTREKEARMSNNWVKLFLEVTMKFMFISIKRFQSLSVYNAIQNTMHHILSTELAASNKIEVLPNEGFYFP